MKAHKVPKPPITEANVPRQDGKVFLVTGGYGGLGYELSKILFNAGGKVYIAGRSVEQGKKAVAEIKAASAAKANPDNLQFVHIDLADLSTVKEAAEEFKTRETKLNVLYQNAAVCAPPEGAITKQGHELQMGTNALGPLLLYELLLPLLQKAAETAPEGSVRVVWSGSEAIDRNAKPGGFSIDEIDKPGKTLMQQSDNYWRSKLANWYLAYSLAKQSNARAIRILHVVNNPGNLRTNLLRHRGWLYVLFYATMHKPIFGAYTNLWSGLSKDIGMADGGMYIEPWGRKHPALRADVVSSVKRKEEGGAGRADEFRDWCLDQIKDFM